MKRRGFLKMLAGLPMLAILKPQRPVAETVSKVTAQEVHTGRRAYSGLSTATDTTKTNVYRQFQPRDLFANPMLTNTTLDHVEHAHWFEGGLALFDGEKWYYTDA